MGSVSHYVMAQTLAFLLFKGEAECSDQFIQLLRMASQEVLDLLDVLQAVMCRRRTRLTWQTQEVSQESGFHNFMALKGVGPASLLNNTNPKNQQIA